MMQFIFVQRRSYKSMTWFIVSRETQAEYEISRQYKWMQEGIPQISLFRKELLQKCILLVINWWIRRLDSRSNRVRIWKRTSDKDSSYLNGHDFTDIYMCIKVEVKSIMGYTRGVSWLWMIFWLSEMVMDWVRQDMKFPSFDGFALLIPSLFFRHSNWFFRVYSSKGSRKRDINTLDSMLWSIPTNFSAHLVAARNLFFSVNYSFRPLCRHHICTIYYCTI